MGRVDVPSPAGSGGGAVTGRTLGLGDRGRLRVEARLRDDGLGSVTVDHSRAGWLAESLTSLVLTPGEARRLAGVLLATASAAERQEGGAR